MKKIIPFATIIYTILAILITLVIIFYFYCSKIIINECPGFLCSNLQKTAIFKNIHSSYFCSLVGGKWYSYSDCTGVAGCQERRVCAVK
ncbi:MAG: hypothetical protein WC460_02990 [Patescibacteria group bacterium]